MNKTIRNTGYICFLLSGFAAISSGIIVSLLQDRYGFGFGVTGMLLSFLNLGNMLASFLSGVLPGRIGAKNTVILLGAGYFIGYASMPFSGALLILIPAFLLVGLAKGCAVNNCTMMVGSNVPDRTKGMTLMNAFYAMGALLCPFFIGALAGISKTLPIFGISLMGLLLWLIMLHFGFPKEGNAGGKERGKTDFSFLRNPTFWILTALLFCQNAAEQSVNGWLVTYYKNAKIISGALSPYTITVMWGATLLGRLLIAFVLRIRSPFRFLAGAGVLCSLLYCMLVMMQSPMAAILALFLFAFAMSGVYPVAVSGVGNAMSPASLGVMLPIGGVGAIVMPYVIGVAGDVLGLKAGMAMNLIPCIGIAVLSMVLIRKDAAVHSI